MNTSSNHTQNILRGGLSPEALPDEISAPMNVGTNGPLVEATNLQALGSYNWVEHDVPTIVAPGRPTSWRNPRLPLHLNASEGNTFYEEDVARLCGFPIEPLLRAIQVTQETLGTPDYKLSDEKIDIVTNRNNLRKLLSFASSSGSRRGRHSARYDQFRIDAQLAPNGRTLVLTRYEPSTTGRGSRQTEFIGYDHLFEKASTSEHPVLRGAEADGAEVLLKPVGYHRIVRYDLLGMRFLVRSRVDAMDESVGSDVGANSGVDDLVEALQSVRLAPSSPPAQVPIVQVGESRLRHVVHGSQVPQDQLMDLKAVTTRGDVNWQNVYPQFFLSQTPTLTIAFRSGGDIVRKQTYARESLRRQHEQFSGQFRALVDVLGQMRTMVQTHGGYSEPLAFVWGGTGNMVAYRIRERGVYLSDEGLDMF